nr:hypothetical protein [Tanacetum cinerariifolium]
MNFAYKTVNVCERCVSIETELQMDFIKRECYDTLFKRYNTLEKHCISLEVDYQLKMEIFQRNISFSQQNYAALNQLSKDFETRFVLQVELSAEQAFWSRYSVQPEEPNLSVSTTIVEVPKKLPKVSMVNSSLKKLKFHLASLNMVVKEKTTATAITEGT